MKATVMLISDFDERTQTWGIRLRADDADCVASGIQEGDEVDVGRVDNAGGEN